MPFRRRSRSTRFRRRRPYSFRGASRFKRGRGRPQGVWRAIRSINNRLTAEVKKADIACQDAAVDIAGVVFNLSAIAQGDTVNTRQGNQIKGKYLQLFGTVTLAALANNVVRVIVVQDTKMTADTAPTVAQVLEGGTFNDQFNITEQSAGRFNILYNKLFVNRIGPAQAEAIVIKKFFNIMKYPKPHFNGANATDFDNNHYFLMIIPATDEQGAIDVTSRLGFYDN